MNEGKEIIKVQLTCTCDYFLTIGDNQKFSQGDIILEDFKSSPIIPFCYFDLTLDIKKMEQKDIDRILAPVFGVYQIELIFDDGAKEILCHKGGINKSKELTKVSCGPFSITVAPAAYSPFLWSVT